MHIALRASGTLLLRVRATDAYAYCQRTGTQQTPLLRYLSYATRPYDSHRTDHDVHMLVRDNLVNGLRHMVLDRGRCVGRNFRRKRPDVLSLFGEGFEL